MAELRRDILRETEALGRRGNGRGLQVHSEEVSNGLEDTKSLHSAIEGERDFGG
jgi:hypothetical protein